LCILNKTGMAYIDNWTGTLVIRYENISFRNSSVNFACFFSFPSSFTCYQKIRRGRLFDIISTNGTQK
jgi:hypothetical protein